MKVKSLAALIDTPECKQKRSIIQRANALYITLIKKASVHNHINRLLRLLSLTE